MKQLALNVCGCPLTISANDGDLLGSLSAHLACCVTGRPPAADGIPLALRLETDDVVASLGDGQMRFPRSNALNVVEDLVVMVVQLHRPPVRFIHCSCVDFDGAAAIFVGASTHGKTTLALALQRAGRRLLSEDKTPLDVEKGRAWPFLTTPTLRTNTERLLGKPTVPATGSKSAEGGIPLKLAFFLSMEGRRPAKVLETRSQVAQWKSMYEFVFAQPAPPGAVAKPLSYYDESAFDADPELRPCSRASLVRKLLPYFFSNNLSVRDTLEQSIGSLKSVRGFVLYPGRLDATVDLVQSVAEGGLQPV